MDALDRRVPHASFMKALSIFQIRRLCTDKDDGPAIVSEGIERIQERAACPLIGRIRLARRLHGFASIPTTPRPQPASAQA